MVPRDPSRGIELRTEQGRLGTKYAVSRDRKSIAKYGVMTTVVSPDPTKNYEEPMEFCSRHLRFIANSYTAVLAEMARASGDQSKNYSFTSARTSGTHELPFDWIYSCKLPEPGRASSTDVLRPTRSTVH